MPVLSGSYKKLDKSKFTSVETRKSTKSGLLVSRAFIVCLRAFCLFARFMFVRALYVCSRALCLYARFLSVRALMSVCVCERCVAYFCICNTVVDENDIGEPKKRNKFDFFKFIYCSSYIYSYCYFNFVIQKLLFLFLCFFLYQIFDLVYCLLYEQ